MYLVRVYLCVCVCVWLLPLFIVKLFTGFLITQRSRGEVSQLPRNSATKFRPAFEAIMLFAAAAEHFRGVFSTPGGRFYSFRTICCALFWFFSCRPAISDLRIVLRHRLWLLGHSSRQCPNSRQKQFGDRRGSKSSLGEDRGRICPSSVILVNKCILLCEVP